MTMDTATKARLRDVYLCLTIAQRANLKAVVEGRHSGLIEPVCESLVDVGLLRRSGDKFVATDAGSYVVTLY
jgi:hypothetical protein